MTHRTNRTVDTPEAPLSLRRVNASYVKGQCSEGSSWTPIDPRIVAPAKFACAKQFYGGLSVVDHSNVLADQQRDRRVPSFPVCGGLSTVPRSPLDATGSVVEARMLDREA